MAELALEQLPEFSDYLAAFKRRRGLITLVAILVFACGLILAFAWPPTYQSMSTILIEEQEIPSELIQSTVTSYASQRIQVISQRVMTRTHLMEIVNKYDLYKSERKRNPIEEVLLNMRNDIYLNMITADVMDPRTGRPTAATIAFNVGYEGENPKLVQQVANELTTLYLNENLRTRTEKATETYDFLTAEANRLKQEIAGYEHKLAEFKEQNLNTLPESRELNSQALARYETELASIDTQTQSLKERKIYLEGQIPLLDPYSMASSVPSPAMRLAALQTEYIRLASRYSPDHPDVIRTRREIKALEKETGIFSSADELLGQLKELRAQLSRAEQEYTPEHPDVVRLKREIAALEDEISHPAADTVEAYPQAAPDNPAYVNLQTQLAAVNSELASMHARRDVTLKKISEYENRLVQTPKVEQEFRILSRDMVNASKRYQDIIGKQRTAEVGKEMEAERKGEKFTLIDPAILPEEPISPNRKAIIIVSLLLALGGGFGAAMARESIDKAVWGEKSIVYLLQQPPLAAIPYLPTAAERRRSSNRKWLIALLVVAGLLAAVAIVHFLISPLDVIWFRGLRKIDNLMAS